MQPSVPGPMVPPPYVRPVAYPGAPTAYGTPAAHPPALGVSGHGTPTYGQPISGVQTHGTPSYGAPGYPYAVPGPGAHPYGGHPHPYGTHPYGTHPYGTHPYGAHPYGPPAYGGQPYGGQPPGQPPLPPGSPYPYPAAYRPRFGLPRPAAVAPVPGTPFGVALVEVRATASGPAAASLVAGLGSILVAMVVILFAAAGAAEGWGPAVSGAFAALATMIGAAAVGLGGTGLHRIRSSVAWGPTRGRGVAVAGVICGAVGLAITALTMLIALVA